MRIKGFVRAALCTCLVVLGWSSSMLATPLTDYTYGKFSFNTSLWYGDSFVQSANFIDVAELGANGALTVALPHDLAVRYRYDQLAFGPGAMTYQDVDVLFKVDFVYNLINLYFSKYASPADAGKESEVKAAQIIQDLRRDNLFGAFIGASKVTSSNMGLDQYSFNIGYITSLKFLYNWSVYSELSIGTNFQIVSDSGLSYQPLDWMDINVGYSNLNFYYENDQKQFVQKAGWYLGATFKN